MNGLFSTSLALLLGQVIIMNIYYQRKQHLDMVCFWKEIIKMSIVPVCLVFIGLLVTESVFFSNPSFVRFVVVGLAFSICYIAAFWIFSMNSEERNLFVKPLTALKNRF